jgi:transcriptional regulator with XRE-family HTH domain
VTAAELRAALARIGWSQVELSRRSGVTPKTVCGWAQGKTIPPWVSAYLSAIEAVRDLAQKVGV